MSTEDQFLGIGYEEPELQEETAEEAPVAQKPQPKSDYEDFITRMKSPSKPSAGIIKTTEGDPVAQAAREWFGAFGQEGLIATDDGSDAKGFAAQVRKVSGGFDAVGLMRSIRNGQ